MYKCHYETFYNMWAYKKIALPQRQSRYVTNLLEHEDY